MQQIINELLENVEVKDRNVLVINCSIALDLIRKKNPASVSVVENKEEDAFCDRKFHAIFYNDLSQKKPSLAEAKSLVKKGNYLINSIKSLFPNLRDIKYSDEDLDAFCSLMAKTEPANVLTFLEDLLDHDQISTEQKERVEALYDLSKEKEDKAIMLSEELFSCLFKNLEERLSPGGTLTGITALTRSLYENVLFFEQIITNPNYEFSESCISIEGEKALSFTVKKKI